MEYFKKKNKRQKIIMANKRSFTIYRGNERITN